LKRPHPVIIDHYRGGRIWERKAEFPPTVKLKKENQEKEQSTAWRGGIERKSIPFLKG